MYHLQLRLLWLIALLGMLCSHPLHAADASPKGLRVLTAGHSFCVPVQPRLAMLAQAAGITDHVLVDTQMLGGSTVTQHWNLPDEKNIAKRDLLAGKADVLILSPHTLVPDPAIPRFTDMLLQYKADGRVLIYEAWMPWDGQHPMKAAELHRDARTEEELRQIHKSWADAMAKQVREINKQYRQPVVFTVPVGMALIKLRGMITAGKVPGITTQDALFSDDMGHPTIPLIMLGAYCEYAVIYQRSPADIPLPAKAGIDAKLSHLLATIAWETVTTDPLSGVMAEKK